MNIKKINYHLIIFQARLGGESYQGYQRHDNYNGQMPDRFIMSRIAMQDKKPQDMLVVDLGAGQGRNTIPLAEKGYNILAYEINPSGIETIKRKVLEANVSDNVVIKSKNILDYLYSTSLNDADVVFMSHISQHFNPQELNEVLKNASRLLKRGGEFIFDALVRQDSTYQEYDVMPPAMIKRGWRDIEDYGAASFKKSALINGAKMAGFESMYQAPFLEKGLKRAHYENQNLWGGFNIFDCLKGIPIKPVKLMWFMFKK